MKKETEMNNEVENDKVKESLVKLLKEELKNFLIFIVFISVMFAGFIFMINDISQKDSSVELNIAQRQSIESNISEFVGMDVEEVQRKMTEPVSRSKSEISVDINTPQGLYRIKFNATSDKPTMTEAYKPQ